MPAIVEDAPQRLTGAQRGQAITLVSAQMNAAKEKVRVARQLAVLPEASKPSHAPSVPARKRLQQAGSVKVCLTTLSTRRRRKKSPRIFSQHKYQMRADALVATVEHFLASVSDYRGLQGLKGAEWCQVVLNLGRKSRIVLEPRKRLPCTV